TELTPGTGTVIGVPGITGFGTRAIDSTGRMMDFDGIGQAVPDVTTRGMARFACNRAVSERYYVDVYPALSAPAKLPPATKGTIGVGCGSGVPGSGTPGNPKGGPPPRPRPPCRDHTPPKSRLVSVHVATEGLSIKGRSSDA